VVILVLSVQIFAMVENCIQQYTAVPVWSVDVHVMLDSTVYSGQPRYKHKLTIPGYLPSNEDD
jgi:hypothetical protein